MQSQTRQVLHLFKFDQQSINQKQLAHQIKSALQTYFGESTPEIHIKGTPHNYSAYFEVDSNTGKKIQDLKTIKIGNDLVNISRYYHDYQIFINRLDPVIQVQQIKKYFEEFGEVLDIVVTHPAQNKDKHCYIKMKDQKTIDTIVLARLHKIAGKEIKPVRTYGLKEEKESDKKLFLKVEGLLESTEDFQQKAIEYFMSHGKIRERPRAENIVTQKYKMIITFINPKDANNAIQAFPKSSWVEESKKKGLTLTLNYFNSKQNKIFVSGLKENSVKVIKDAFEHFGQISEITVNKTKNNTLTAVIGYVNENDFKMALGAYIEMPKIKEIFLAKPYVTIFMTNEEKRSYEDMKKKNHPIQNKNNFVPFGLPYQNQQLGFAPQFPANLPNNLPMGMPGSLPNHFQQNIPMIPLQGQFQPQMGGMRGGYQKQHFQPKTN